MNNKIPNKSKVGKLTINTLLLYLYLRWVRPTHRFFISNDLCNVYECLLFSIEIIATVRLPSTVCDGTKSADPPTDRPTVRNALCHAPFFTFFYTYFGV